MSEKRAGVTDGRQQQANEEAEDEDGLLQGMGFMFDEALPKRSLRHTFRAPGGSSLDVIVACVDDTPGALQSGHYVWPGAPALAQYLLDKWSTLGLPNNSRVIELGAGCGLVGLTLAQLPGCGSVTFTDHDPGTLKLIVESMRLQHENLRAECRTVLLEWGPINQGPLAGQRFDLVVGSDLIYCAGVVRPLMETVRCLLSSSSSSSPPSPSSSSPSSDGRSRMLLMGSFALTPDCEEALDNVCKHQGLRREVISRIGEGSKVWTEEFYLLPPQTTHVQ